MKGVCFMESYMQGPDNFPMPVGPSLQIEDSSRFFYEVVHESKNILTACEGFIQLMLSRGSLNLEHLGIIQGELKRAISILSDYGYVSKPNNNIEHYDINSCITNIALLLSPKLKEKGIDLNLHLSDIPNINVDPAKIKQVLLNTIENASDAVGSNGSIDVFTHHDETFITIKVQDSGCGIDPSLMGMLFKPFFTTKLYGTGLGLYVCKKIIESYNGRISLESSPSSGTAVTLAIPVGSDKGECTSL